MKNLKTPWTRERFKALGLLAIFLCLPSAHAEQKQVFGDFEVHYIVLPTVSLNAEVAARYGITRAQSRSLVNISVLDGSGNPTASNMTGIATNLLGQRQTLKFDEVREGEAIYYLALLSHADEEFYRLVLQVPFPNGESAELRFEQLMYWER